MQDRYFRIFLVTRDQFYNFEKVVNLFLLDHHLILVEVMLSLG